MERLQNQVGGKQLWFSLANIYSRGDDTDHSSGVLGDADGGGTHSNVSSRERGSGTDDPTGKGMCRLHQRPWLFGILPFEIYWNNRFNPTDKPIRSKSVVDKGLHVVSDGGLAGVEKFMMLGRVVDAGRGREVSVSVRWVARPRPDLHTFQVSCGVAWGRKVRNRRELSTWYVCT